MTVKPSVIDYFGTGNDAGDYSFLSNFFKSGRTTVEHHYQAAKTDDPAWAAKIIAAPTPGQAKKLGRKAPMRPTWDDEKDTVMLVLLRLKFSNPELATRLLDTGNAELIEGNHWGDSYWGCTKKNGEWVGENKLGKLLMAIRQELRAAL
jgi:ribA/ribD-fused uncharacterized protein